MDAVNWAVIIDHQLRSILLTSERNERSTIDEVNSNTAVSLFSSPSIIIHSIDALSFVQMQLEVPSNYHIYLGHRSKFSTLSISSSGDDDAQIEIRALLELRSFLSLVRLPSGPTRQSAWTEANELVLYYQASPFWRLAIWRRESERRTASKIADATQYKISKSDVLKEKVFDPTGRSSPRAWRVHLTAGMCKWDSKYDWCLPSFHAENRIEGRKESF